MAAVKSTTHILCSRTIPQLMMKSQGVTWPTKGKSDFTLTAILIQWWAQQNIKDWKFTIIHLNLMFSTKQPDQFSRLHAPILILFTVCDISVPESEQITDPNKEPQTTTSSRSPEQWDRRLPTHFFRLWQPQPYLKLVISLHMKKVLTGILDKPRMAQKSTE